MSTAVNHDASGDVITLQNALVDLLIKNESIQSEAVAAAFRAVPRHPFLPDKPLEEVYSDNAIPTHFDDDGQPVSSSSQPAIMALMLEQLDLQPGQQVLEVGAGTGYNAALMGHLVGANGHVTAVDIDAEIANSAQEHLAAIGCTNISVVCGDGMDGYEANAPYDRIILTVGGWDIAPAWREQLKPDGRILLPLSLNGPQYAIAFDRTEDCLTSVSIEGCGFMRLRGPHAGPDVSLTLNDEQTMHLLYEDSRTEPRQIDINHAKNWLAGPYQDTSIELQVSPQDVWGSLLLWLALRMPDLVALGAKGEAVTSATFPTLLGQDGPNPWRMSHGTITPNGMAFYMRQPAPADETELFALGIRHFGTGNAGHQLQQQALAWDTAGRPRVSGMRVRAFPLHESPQVATAVARRWHTFVVDWPSP